SRSRRVVVNAHRGKHDEHPVAPGYGALDDLAVIRRSRNDSNAPLEGIELLHAALAAHADHRIAPIQRVLHHVDSELPRGPDDADLHHVRHAHSSVTPSAVSNYAPAFTLARLSTELLSRHVNRRATCRDRSSVESRERVNAGASLLTADGVT